MTLVENEFKCESFTCQTLMSDNDDMNHQTSSQILTLTEETGNVQDTEKL